VNGKVERSHRVDDQEFYQLLDRDGIADDIHLFNAKLKEWEDYYNYTGRTGRWRARPRTSGYWQRQEPERHRRPENLHKESGAPCTTRTCDLLVRSQTLYPAELRARKGN
jgi:hypothetical protein